MRIEFMTIALQVQLSPCDLRWRLFNRRAKECLEIKTTRPLLAPVMKSLGIILCLSEFVCGIVRPQGFEPRTF